MACADTVEPETEESPMHPETKAYNEAQEPKDRAVCKRLAQVIDRHLPDAENKVRHRHPSHRSEDRDRRGSQSQPAVGLVNDAG